MNVRPHIASPARFRAIWISDFHLGTRRAQADLLLDFLRTTESETLYLVGDIVDNWSLKKTWYWDWSLSAYLKNRVKKAVEFLSNFEQAVAREARRRCADGVICGHVHTPDIRNIDGIEYLNDGDWVESCSALVEHFDGTFELIHWRTLATVPERREKAIAHPARNGRLVSAG
jgi:UDP-2,3-diacylglucosamine pyrophosphatase LpxH